MQKGLDEAKAQLEAGKKFDFEEYRKGIEEQKQREKDIADAEKADA